MDTSAIESLCIQRRTIEHAIKIVEDTDETDRAMLVRKKYGNRPTVEQFESISQRDAIVANIQRLLVIIDEVCVPKPAGS